MDVKCWGTWLGWLLVCFLLKTFTVWSKDARPSLPDPTLLSTLNPFCLPLLFYVPVLSFIFTLSIPLLSSLSDGSLRSFTSKDVFVPLFCLQRCGLRQTGGLCLWFTEQWGWSKRQRFGEATSGDVDRCISIILGQTEFTRPSNMAWSPKRSRQYSIEGSFGSICSLRLCFSLQRGLQRIWNPTKQIHWKWMLGLVSFYGSEDQMDCLEILYRYSWSTEDESHFGDPLTFSLDSQAGQMFHLSCEISQDVLNRLAQF